MPTWIAAGSDPVITSGITCLLCSCVHKQMACPWLLVLHTKHSSVLLFEKRTKHLVPSSWTGVGTSVRTSRRAVPWHTTSPVADIKCSCSLAVCWCYHCFFEESETTRSHNNKPQCLLWYIKTVKNHHHQKTTKKKPSQIIAKKNHFVSFVFFRTKHLTDS